MTGSARVRNVVFSLATTLALGFGAAQAFAAPGAAAGAAVQACTSLQSYRCGQDCKSRGYPWGTCAELPDGSTYCNCF
jgi:hypothetical protein